MSDSPKVATTVKTLADRTSPIDSVKILKHYGYSSSVVTLTVCKYEL